MQPPLREVEQRFLLEVARRAIRARLSGDPAPTITDPPPRLLAIQGAFVSLHREGDLRGCIGMVDPDRPLVDTVARCAAAAATEDPRFPPLSPGELDVLSIEISVLGPLFVVRDPSEIVLGRHGIIVTKGDRRGLLLPQVPIQQGWDLKTFLREACRKAVLDAQAWQRGAVIEAFGTQVFSEPGALSEPPPGSPPPSPSPIE